MWPFCCGSVSKTRMRKRVGPRLDGQRPGMGVGGIAGSRALPLEVMGRTQQGQPGHKKQWFRAET